MNKQGVIYLLINTQTGMGYVGKTTVPIKTRWQRHCYDANKRQLQTFLARAIRKYSKEAFAHRILERTSLLNEREQFWIRELGTLAHGYNLTTGGEGTKGIKRSEKTKEKISKALKGRKFSKEHKKKAQPCSPWKRALE